MNQHWSEDRLMDRLYGVVEADAHLDACHACQARLNQMQQRRGESVRFATPPVEFFHRQRNRIQSRMATPAWSAVWVPATLAVALVAGLVLTTRTAPLPPMLQQDEAVTIEAGWFEDHYSATRELEPRAASPIRQLFAEGPVLE